MSGFFFGREWVGWESQQAGLCCFPFVCSPGVCFVLKGLLLPTVLMCTGEAGQWRRMVTDSSHRAAGEEEKGSFPSSGDASLPHAESVISDFPRCLLEKVVDYKRIPLRAICRVLGVEVTAGLCGGWCLCFHRERGTGPVPASRSGTAYGQAGRLPAGPQQLNHTSRFHKHAFLLLITEDSDDNRGNQPQIQTGCGRR